MLRRTSKRVKEVVDKMRLPAIVRLSRSFWDDARNGTEEAKLQFVMRQLLAMTARCLITTLELLHGGARVFGASFGQPEMKGQDAERLAGVLTHCTALARLDLTGNRIGAGGAESLAGVLGQCTALSSISAAIRSVQPGHRVLQEFSCIAKRWST